MRDDSDSVNAIWETSMQTKLIQKRVSIHLLPVEGGVFCTYPHSFQGINKSWSRATGL